jgi:hypothetical protein
MTARDLERTILRALADRGQSATASTAGVSETRMSRWKSESESGGGLNLDETTRVLHALGLRIVADEGGMVTMSTASHDALHVLLRDYAEMKTRSATPR